MDLRGQHRHELACSACGAPLSKLKMLPKPEPAAPVAANRSAPSGAFSASDQRLQAKRKSSKKIKKRKPLGKKIFEELWDVIEDIID